MLGRVRNTYYNFISRKLFKLSLNLLRILRDYTPKLVCLYLNKRLFSNSLKNNDFNSSFASYLTGLIEGDGAIVVPNTEKSTKGILNYPLI